MNGVLRTRFSWLERVLTGVVVLLSGIFLTFLLQQSVFLTTQDTHSIDTGYTRGYYTADPAPWAHLLVFALLAALAWFLARRPAARERLRLGVRRAAPVLTGVMLALLFWLAAGYRMEPVDDAGAVWRCAQQLLAGDTTSLGPGGYLNLCPNNMFLTLYDMAFLALFGTGGALAALQLANVLWLALAIVSAAAAAACLHTAPQRRGVYQLLLALWLPVGLYVTFMYGTLPGLALSAGGGIALLNAGPETEALSPRSVLRCLSGALALALAALFKQNYLITAIAVCLYLGWRTLRAAAAGRGRAAWTLPLLGAAAVVVFYAGANAAVSAAMYAGTGLTPGGGKPVSSWLALGMQDIDASEGWIGVQEGGAVERLYFAEGKAAADAYCKASIRARLAEFRADPAMMLRFYARKMTSQWNMPTFQSLDTNRNRELIPRGVRWAEELLAVGGRLEPLYRMLADLALTQLWAWALVNLVLRRRTLRPEDVFFYVVFLGGFVFHLFWEAKAQYTLVYAFLLLPCALDGLCAFGHWAAQRPAAGDARRTLWPAVLIVGVLAASGVSGNYLSCSRAEAKTAAAAYAAWRAEQTPALPEGTHIVYQAQSGVPLTVDTATRNAHLDAARSAGGTPLTLLPLHNRLLLDSVPQVQACQILVAPENTTSIGMGSYEGEFFVNQKTSPDPYRWTQQWLLLPGDGETWALCILDVEGNLLAMNDNGDGTLSLAPYDGSPAQCWCIAPAVI